LETRALSISGRICPKTEAASLFLPEKVEDMELNRIFPGEVQIFVGRSRRPVAARFEVGARVFGSERDVALNLDRERPFRRLGRRSRLRLSLDLRVRSGIGTHGWNLLSRKETNIHLPRDMRKSATHPDRN
jgi:hypothetical protein